MYCYVPYMAVDGTTLRFRAQDSLAGMSRSDKEKLKKKMKRELPLPGIVFII